MKGKNLPLEGDCQMKISRGTYLFGFVFFGLFVSLLACLFVIHTHVNGGLLGKDSAHRQINVRAVADCAYKQDIIGENECHNTI